MWGSPRSKGTARPLDDLVRALDARIEAYPRVSGGAEPQLSRRAGLGDERRPIGSFLFLGPTGVGKTELARPAVSRGS